MTERFEWTRVMHELARRHLTVLRSETVAPRMQRVTLGGAELEGFTSLAPGDHVKIFFPDPATGEIATPTFVNGRPQAPEHGEVIVRDYTPYEFRPDAADGPELDIDFVLHHDAADGAETGDAHSGPAAAWAAAAAPGDALIIAGPRGSLIPPRPDNALLIADESALPATTRWLDALEEIPVIALLSALDPATSSYLDSRTSASRDLRWFSGADRTAQIETSLRELQIGEGTLVFLAGEATSLIPLRRYLRRELGLPKAQVDAHGYWKQGEANLDHHAPLDPSDPD